MFFPWEILRESLNKSKYAYNLKEIIWCGNFKKKKKKDAHTLRNLSLSLWFKSSVI